MLEMIRIRAGVLLLLMSCVSNQLAAAPPKAVLNILEQKCLKCHGGAEVNGEVDFKQVTVS